jgi:hypothetical protein
MPAVFIPMLASPPKITCITPHVSHAVHIAPFLLIMYPRRSTPSPRPVQEQAVRWMELLAMEFWATSWWHLYLHLFLLRRLSYTAWRTFSSHNVFVCQRNTRTAYHLSKSGILRLYAGLDSFSVVFDVTICVWVQHVSAASKSSETGILQRFA